MSLHNGIAISLVHSVAMAPGKDDGLSGRDINAMNTEREAAISSHWWPERAFVWEMCRYAVVMKMQPTDRAPCIAESNLATGRDSMFIARQRTMFSVWYCRFPAQQ